MEEDQQQSIILEFGVQAFTLHTYTVYEHTVLLRIFKCCQRDISDAITIQAKEKQLIFSREEAAEQMRHRRIPLAKLESNKTHYSRLRHSLTDMAGKQVGIPFYNASRAFQYAWFPQLFTVSFQKENKRDYAVLHIKLAVLRRYLSIAMGYHRLNLATYFSFAHFATRQAYRFYYAYFSRNGEKLKPEFIAQAFSATGNYPSYANVKKNLLDPAVKEMKKAYENGTCEIHFRYKAIYNDEANKGIWADNVLFTYIHRDDDHPEGEKLRRLTTCQGRVKVVLKGVWGVDEKVAEQLSQRIRYTMMPELDEFFRRKTWFAARLEREGKALRNKGGYMRKALTDFLDEQEGKETE